MKRKKNKRNQTIREIPDYDNTETTGMLNPRKPLKFQDLGIALPEQPPTQVISIRLPTDLLNQIKAFSSQRDIPYQALIKLFLSDALADRRKKAA